MGGCDDVRIEGGSLLNKVRSNGSGTVLLSELLEPDVSYRALKRVLKVLRDTHPNYPRRIEKQSQPKSVAISSVGAGAAGSAGCPSVGTPTHTRGPLSETFRENRNQVRSSALSLPPRTTPGISKSRRRRMSDGRSSPPHSGKPSEKTENELQPNTRDRFANKENLREQLNNEAGRNATGGET